MRESIVLVCGGRHYDDRDAVFRSLDRIRSTCGVYQVIQGGATGADRLADAWARARDIESITMKADWKSFGRKAGPIRNEEMLSLGPDVVLAFPGGRGTADMVKRAQRAGIRVLEPYTPPSPGA